MSLHDLLTRNSQKGEKKPFTRRFEGCNARCFDPGRPSTVPRGGQKIPHKTKKKKEKRNRHSLGTFCCGTVITFGGKVVRTFPGRFLTMCVGRGEVFFLSFRHFFIIPSSCHERKYPLTKNCTYTYVLSVRLSIRDEWISPVFSFFLLLLVSPCVCLSFSCIPLVSVSVSASVSVALASTRRRT